MNKSYLFFLGAIAAGLGAIIYAEANTITELNRSMDKLRASEKALRDQAAKDRDEIAKLQGQIASFKEESEALRKRLASGPNVEAAAGAQPGSAPAAAGKEDAKGNWLKSIAKMYSDPEMKKSMKAQQAMQIRTMYGDLFKQLGLSPQDAEQLADILAERQMELSATAMAAMTGDGKLDPDQSQKIADASQRYDEQLKATLGEANYKKLQDYEKTMGDRTMMQQYDGQFAAAGAPLEPKQREALLQIMQDERLKAPASPLNEGNTNPKAALDAMQDPKVIDQYFEQQEALNRRVLERARQTLSADQITVLQKAQQQTAEMMRGMAKMSREFIGK